MIRLTSFHSSPLAHLAAAHLRDHGVMAGVIDGSVSVINHAMLSPHGKGSYELVIASKRSEELALELLAQFKQDPPTIDPGWEDQVQPDLSLLDKSLIPGCPGCRFPISIARPLGPCARCGAGYDLQQMIFERHGPEALAGCYETQELMSGLSDEEVCAIPLDCNRCGYPLDGLAISGRCPECSEPFERRSMFSDILSP